MAKAEVKYLIGTLICALVGVGLIIVSLSTENWLTSQPELKSQATNSSSENKASEVNYGLFLGTLAKSNIFNNELIKYDLTLTCLISEVVCAWSCLATGDARTTEVEALFEGETVSFGCSPAKLSQTHFHFNSNALSEKLKPRDTSRFLNAGMWISTILFLTVSLAFNLVGCGFTLLNILSNPVETYAGVLGLYVWFGISAAADVLVLILWGAEFGIRLSTNIAIYDTIVDGSLDSDGKSQLGYSYFLIIPVELSHIVAIGLVYYRQRILNKPDSQTTIAIEEKGNDKNVFLY